MGARFGENNLAEDSWKLGSRAVVTISLYLLQVAVVGGLLSLLLRNSHWILRIQVLIWAIVTAAIAARYGLIEQLNFYSNDQRYHTEAVETFTQQLGDVDFLLTGSRLPYTLPAFVLYAVGIHPTLALKTVSLVCLLLLTHGLRDLLADKNRVRQSFVILITGCGTIGLFFSALALRETMMMLFTSRFLRTKSIAERLTAALVLFLLRPHLGVSLAIASLIIWIFMQMRTSRVTNVSTVSFLVICGILTGNYLYRVGERVLYGAASSVSQPLLDGIVPLTRIASNFVGFQFLTVQRDTVEFSILSLLLLRVILIETLLIPSLFTTLVFVKSQRLNMQHLTLLLAFSIYVALVVNTDFNSFRQNIPFMPIMGVTVLYLLKSPRPTRPVALSRHAPRHIATPLASS